MVNPRQQRARARDAGRQAVASIRRRLAQRIVDQLRENDPEMLSGLLEIGVVSHDWIDQPGAVPMSDTAPIEVVERLLERTVERRPSLLATMGLSAIQVLASGGDEGDEAGMATRLTVAFTDLEDFTRFTATEGDEAASQLLAEHHRIIGPIVRSRGGRLVKRLGAGLLLTFPEPEAAVLACLELVASQPGPLRLRGGLHLGDVIVTRDDVIGHTVNVAARVAETADGGQVLATAPVWEAVAAELPGVSFGPPIARAFKGIDEDVVMRAVSPIPAGDGRAGDGRVGDGSGAVGL